jgi:hypothetical protein
VIYTRALRDPRRGVASVIVLPEQNGRVGDPRRAAQPRRALVELARDTCKLDKEGAPGLDMLAEVFD